MTLLAAYNFDEGTGTTAADVSGNSRTVTLNSTGWATGHTNTGLARTGSGDAEYHPWSGTGASTASSATFWIKLTSGGSGNIFSLKNNSTVDELAVYAPGSGQMSAYVRSTSGATSPSVGSGLAGSWHHVGVTWDGTTVTCYLDGVSVATSSLGGTMTLSGSNTGLFLLQSCNSVLDDVRVYDVALTQSQIATDMSTPVTAAAPASNAGALVATLPITTASTVGSQTDPAVSAASLPKATASVAGAQTNAAALAVPKTPQPKTVVSGTQKNVAVLAAASEVVTGSFTISSTDPGSLSAAAPLATAQIASTQVNPGALTAATPSTTGSITASTAADLASLAVTVPLLTTTITGTQVNGATLAAATPVDTGYLYDTLVIRGSLSASQPLLSTNLSGTQVNTGTTSTTLPVATAQISGTPINVGSWIVMLPALTATVAPTQANPVTLATSVPLITVQASDNTANTGTFTTTLPMLLATIHGITGIRRDIDFTVSGPYGNTIRIAGPTGNPLVLTGPEN